MNESGGADAERGVEIVEQGLLYAKLPKPWQVVVRRSAMHWFNGFSLHAAALGRQRDGSVVYVDIAHRPAHTISQWYRKDSQSAWDSVRQEIGDGSAFSVPLDECLYLVSDQLGDAPHGTGVLALVAERLRRIGKYEGLEGHELFSSLGGLPIARVPLEELIRTVPPGYTDEQASSYLATSTAAVTNAVKGRIKTPERQQYLQLDSATYADVDGNPGGVKKWDVEIVKGDLQGLGDIRRVINELHLDVARILGVEFAFVGGGEPAGTYGMHESKLSMFAATLQTTLSEIATAAEQQLVHRLIAANGLDPETAAPYLVPAPIGTADVEKAARTLGLINMAQLPPNHPAKIAMYERLDLPWVPEDDAPLMLPRRPFELQSAVEDVPDVKPIDEEDVVDVVEEKP